MSSKRDLLALYFTAKMSGRPTTFTLSPAAKVGQVVALATPGTKAATPNDQTMVVTTTPTVKTFFTIFNTSDIIMKLSLPHCAIPEGTSEEIRFWTNCEPGLPDSRFVQCTMILRAQMDPRLLAKIVINNNINRWSTSRCCGRILNFFHYAHNRQYFLDFV